jgi:hypothetical protein
VEFTIDTFNTVKQNAENFYNKLGSVRCPYFGEDVHFNVKGWEHLVFKGFNRTRLVEDQFARFRHLALAPEILRNSKTLQGIWRTQKFERLKRKNGWEKVLKVTTYYEFIAIMESHGAKVRVKIIVKQVEGAEKHFLSIIPSWGVNRQTGEKVLHSGDPETD